MRRVAQAPRASDQSAASPPEDPWCCHALGNTLPIEDLTKLEPPEPLSRVLAACAVLAPGMVYRAHLPRTPTMLFPHLEARGLAWQVVAQPDGTALLWVRGPTT